MQPPPGSIHFYLNAPDTGFLVETINEGLIHYVCDAAYCYRTTAGEVQENDRFFPNIEAQNNTITTFMLGIGAGTDPTTDPAQIWQKAATTWNWLQSNSYYNQHMATILYISNRWVHLDPSYIHHSFPTFADFHSIPHGGSVSRDYKHP